MFKYINIEHISSLDQGHIDCYRIRRRGFIYVSLNILNVMDDYLIDKDTSIYYFAGYCWILLQQTIEGTEVILDIVDWYLSFKSAVYHYGCRRIVNLR